MADELCECNHAYCNHWTKTGSCDALVVRDIRTHPSDPISCGCGQFVLKEAVDVDVLVEGEPK